jgi:hypothetical protein
LFGIFLREIPVTMAMEVIELKGIRTAASKGLILPVIEMATVVKL